MKARLENGMLLVDFNSRGWNPEEVMEMNNKQFSRFLDISKSDHDEIEYMDLACMVDVIVQMVRNGDFDYTAEDLKDKSFEEQIIIIEGEK